jgi:YVTN family beta-propeller protein
LLSRVDPQSGAVESFVPAVAPGAVWVTSSGSNLLSRVDPQSGAVVARIPVGPTPRFVAVGEGGVWTLNQGDGSVSRVDPATNRVVATIQTGIPPGPGGDIAAGLGFVWVAAKGIPVTKIDPASNKVVAQFVAKGGDALRVGFGSVWLCSFILQEVWRVDPGF